MVKDIRISQSFREEMQESDTLWKSMVKKINIMKTKDVYELVKRPKVANVISVKWVYALKFNGDGVFVDRKSRIVVKRYLQVQGIDFEETYTASVHLESFWLLLAIVTLLELYL